MITVPTAFAQVVETKGQNYDLVENFFIGEANWVSHPERIMDGGWKNYALSNTAEKVIFNTNSVGSFIFDKNSCSYSIYENGFNGEQIIPSVSAVATYLNNGQWQNLPVNDEACTVTVSEYEDSVFLTSTKVITEDITEDIFIDYTGTTENFYGNATNANFNLIQSSNGTNTGYFNGETRVLESVEVGKFVQELRLDINSGFKETFKVTHDGSEELGISQTIHSGESITIGQTVIDIAELNGQSFDRQFIIDNEAEILAITDSVKYDFDTGIESLSNVNIIFDGDYKVNLDYAGGGFVGYLEIDPTFTQSGTAISVRDSSGVTGSVCAGNSLSLNTDFRIDKQSSNSNINTNCIISAQKFDVTSLPDAIVITDAQISYTVTGVNGVGENCEWTSLENDPDTLTAQQLWNDITGDDGTTTVFLNENSCTTTGSKTVTLGSSVYADIANEVSTGDNEWAVGIKHASMTRTATSTNTPTQTFSSATLDLTYTVPIAPQPPTGLTTVTGIPIELDWTAPVDNGGSSITGYKVYRTLNEFALSELPDNSANSNGVDFIDNEFLVHDSSLVSGTLTTPTITKSAGTVNSGQTHTGFGNSWGFDGGLKTYVTDSMDLSGDWTLSYWWERDGSSGVQSPMYFNNGVVYLYHYTDSNPSSHYQGIGSNSGAPSGCGTSWSPNSWQHTTFTVSSGTIQVYLNGVACGSSWTQTGFTNHKIPIGMKYEEHTGAMTNMLVGSMDEIVFYDRTLTSGEVTSLYGGTLPTSQTLYYSMDSTSNLNNEVSALITSISDSSVNSIPITGTTTSTTGVISTGLQDPNLSFTDSNIPDNTDDFSIGSWVKLDTTPINTKLLGLNDVTFNVGTTSASVDGIATVNYKVHSFTSSGNFQITSGSGNVDYLMVAGGGGGGGSKTGNSGGGGGGAGGMLQNTASLSSNTYSITVGQGGTGGIGGYGTGNGGCTGDDGTDSTFNSLTAIGGGGGAGGSGQGGNCAHGVGNDGGSGGGEGTYGQYGTTSSPYYGTGTSGQGNNGGAQVPYGTGGGGGAGSVGGTGTSSTSGSGGDGLSSSITGTATFYAGGGGGAGYDSNGGTGGSSIGGDGGAHGGTSNAYGGGNGVANTGSGGGGASICTSWACSSGAVGGSGSDGIVIVKYVDDGSITATGGTVTTTSAQSPITIINANGLTDNTSSPQHYTFTRDGNDWKIYQNGVSEATATDSTSLGTNVGNNYSTNLDGMIDEYFVNSDVLTSTEIDNIYDRGVVPTLLTTVTATEHDDSTVVGGNNYYYSVKATNAIGDSDFLTPFVSGLAGTPPGVPTGVSTAINNPNTTPLDITVSWSAPTNVGSGTLTGFEIYRDGVLVDTVGLVSSIPNTVPSGGGTFVYSMKAVSTHGTSGLSGTSSITTPSIPDTPAAPTGSINDPNGSPLDVTVSWVAPNAGGSAITNYDLYRSSTSGSGFTVIQSGVTGLTHTDTTPSAGTWYYTVAANNLVGSSLQSPELSVSTPSVPSAVSDLAGSTVSDTAINLTWSAPSNGGSNIIDYSVYRDGVSIDTVTTPGYSDTGLTQQTSYTYTVYARNNVGTSLVSNSISQETHGVPAVVPSFQATSAALDAITLSWTEPNDYNSAITSYVIERESPVGGGFAPLDTISPATTYSDTGLVSVQEYNYRIKAVNSYGNGPTTTSSTITLPAPPTDVVVTPSTSTSELTVTWNTPTLTTGITGYQIVREDGVGTGFNPITIASGTSFTDTGLSTNIYYNYKMASVTVQGNSAYSNTYVQTTYHLPNGVESLTATSGELIDAGLSWSAPSVPYGYITGYEIYQSTTGTPNVLIDSITATSYTATNLDPTVTYYWLVAPVTIHGSNSTGNIANATATSEIIIGDIELSTDVNTDTAPILFDQVRTGNSTALTVTYPNTYDLTCETEYKFGRNTQSYSNLVPVTVSSTQSSHTFNFNNSANEIISVRCYDENTNPGGVNPNDPNDGKDQINFSTQPIVTQVNDFQKGLYGISGGFGAFDLATLFVVIISMVGFNRRNPAVGVGIMVTFIGAMAYFGIIETPTIVMGAIALVTVLAIGVARNKL